MNWKVWLPIGAACVVVAVLVGNYVLRTPAPDAPAATVEAPAAEAAPSVDTATLPPASDVALPPELSAEANAKFLSDNAAKPGVIKRPSGLQYRVIASGTGRTPTPSDMATVTYKGWLINGMVFDATPEGETATFPAGALIPGWVEALTAMKEGDEWEIVIPSELGYGPAGAGGGVIPPNQTLVFNMKLLKVE